MRFENIKKSPNDNCVYRGLILNNDMKVLLISDSTTDRSAACLDVNVGFMSDPAELPGLAHLCMHMLMLDTEKYPNDNEFYSYVTEHGGYVNTTTLFDSTMFYFDIVSNKLEEALDKFSQSFHKPLLAESMIAPVIDAINSEHNSADYLEKINQLDRSSADPQHPFSKFGTGNRETLYVNPKKNGINVRDELLKFHGTWYSANIMALSVLGKESLNDLEKMIVKMFAKVQNKRVKALECLHHPFNKNHYGHKWFIVPMADIRLLKVFFPLPKLQEHYKADDIVYNQSPSRRKLAIHVISTAEGGAGDKKNINDNGERNKKPGATTATKITDVIAFKASQSLYPLVKPYNNIPIKGSVM
ncbi:insulin-degrading enzyme-like [Fopius arisanus]|uniref:Insulin-degrading enzyme-like n=1 Tax=Fopius arisanus TaxID=64838 RepID=A0A9R1U9I5_9HYME|nr:PREDICTED: insulin-degrading enzyme-like [Fopius arisanus]